MSKLVKFTIPKVEMEVVVTWCRRYTTMSPTYRRIRAQSDSYEDACYFCGHEFQDGEVMHMAHVCQKGNKTVCGPCVEKYGLIKPKTDE